MTKQMVKKSAKNSTKDEANLDRREEDRRTETAFAEANPAKTERRKVTRRRQIDPTTCERDYTNVEIEFMQAMDAYKRSSGRMFPTCSEILEVVRALGYVRADGEVASVEVVVSAVESDENEELSFDSDEFADTGCE